MTRRLRGILIGIAVAVALVLLGVVFVYARPLPSASTPEGTALRYYALQSVGRQAEARSLMAGEYLWSDQERDEGHTFFGFAPSYEFGLRNLKTDGSRRESADSLVGRRLYIRQYKEVFDVNVLFTTWRGDGQTTDGGRQFRIITVGRNSASEPWRILEIGTGG